MGYTRGLINMWTRLMEDRQTFEYLYKVHEIPYLRYIQQCFDQGIAGKSFKQWYNERTT